MKRMPLEFGAAFIQKPLDEGLQRNEILDLFDMMKGVSAIPMEVQAENTIAMGFVNRTDAELMGFDLRQLEEFVRNIISDVENEDSSKYYKYSANGVGIIDIYIGYGN